MQQEVVLAMLAKEPSYGYQLRARLRDALGPLGDAMNAGQVYVTLTRLEKAGLLAVERSPMAPTGRIARCTRSPPTANSESLSGSPRWVGQDPTWRSFISS